MRLIAWESGRGHCLLSQMGKHSYLLFFYLVFVSGLHIVLGLHNFEILCSIELNAFNVIGFPHFGFNILFQRAHLVSTQWCCLLYCTFMLLALQLYSVVGALSCHVGCTFICISFVVMKVAFSHCGCCTCFVWVLHCPSLGDALIYLSVAPVLLQCCTCTLHVALAHYISCTIPLCALH